MGLRTLLLFSLPLYIFTETLERIILSEEQTLTCGQGIIYCKVKKENSGNLGACIRHDENVYVNSLDACVVLCQTQEKTWSLCLKILVNITVRGQSVDVELEGNSSGDEEAEEVSEEEHRSVLHEEKDNMLDATVHVCYAYSSLPKSKMLSFTFPSSAIDDGSTLEVWMSLVVVIRETDLGSPVIVYSPYTNSPQRISISTLSKEEVCSKGLNAVFCKDGPRLLKKIDHRTGTVKLYVDDADKKRFQEFHACQKLEREGHCLKVEWNDASHEFEISLGSVAPCMCFEIWGDFPRKAYCPFLNETVVVSDSNVSVSVSATEIHKLAESDKTALTWSLSAPCRLEIDLWLCMKSSGPSICNQINITNHVHKFQNDKWINTDIGQWQIQGEFLNVEPSSLLCMQVKVKGMDGFLGPVCPFEVKRAHWSLLLLVCVLLVCLFVLGAYAFQDAIKCWVFRWLKVNNMKSAAGNVEVLLVYPPDADHQVTELVCHLSSSLTTLGFSVSLDLWSRSEINALGPIPWLHSRLDQIQVHGGRAVLLLAQTTCEQAKKWGHRSEGEDIKADFKSSICLDIFNASLSCILADYLLGHAGKRFMLAQFEAQSPGSVVTFPEFFQGLPLFSLPSQSLSFLMELTHEVQMGQGMARRWIQSKSLSAAAQALSGGLCVLTGSTKQSGTKDALEDVPLDQDQTTPPTNSTFNTKPKTKSWI